MLRLLRFLAASRIMFWSACRVKFGGAGLCPKWYVRVMGWGEESGDRGDEEEVKEAKDVKEVKEIEEERRLPQRQQRDRGGNREERTKSGPPPRPGRGKRQDGPYKRRWKDAVWVRVGGRGWSGARGQWRWWDRGRGGRRCRRGVGGVWTSGNP